jgi:hypothetical protein
MNAVLSGFVLLKAKDTEGKLMLTHSVAVQSILAGAKSIMLGEAHTVLDTVAVAYDRADLRVSLTGEGNGKAAIAEALYGQLMALGVASLKVDRIPIIAEFSSAS